MDVDALASVLASAVEAICHPMGRGTQPLYTALAGEFHRRAGVGAEPMTSRQELDEEPYVAVRRKEPAAVVQAYLASLHSSAPAARGRGGVYSEEELDRI